MVVNIHVNEISIWEIIFRLLHVHTTNTGGINDDVQYDLSTLEFNKGEQFEDI